jgi:protein-glutamine gamma-glutamyltransferase
MIQINQTILNVGNIDGGLPQQKKKILETMAKSRTVYRYHTMDQLDFELQMRTEIIKAANLFSKSGVQFAATFSTTKGNEMYWSQTSQGGLALKPNATPHAGIEDIFMNGNKYAVECATATVIIFYKAVLESIRTNYFNQLFSNLVLYDWQYDQDLGLIVYRGTDFLPGDCVYFNNPDVDPRISHLRGENSIILEENLYFGHGAGIKTRQETIQFLNSTRKPNAKISAYLMDLIARLNFSYLLRYRRPTNRQLSTQPSIYDSSSLVMSVIGSKTYIF